MAAVEMKEPQPLTPEEARKLDSYWRAANYLSVGQIYLHNNPLLREPLKLEHVKPRLLGHWGTTPGLNFIYVHLNRLIKKNDLNMIYRDDPETMHQLMAMTLDKVIGEIQAIQKDAREHGFSHRPQFPMIILRSPKGWTGPKFVDGLPTENSFRSHQVPLAELASKPEHLKMLEEWMRSYKPEELFDESGKLIAELAELAPKGERRMGANPHANGGLLLEDLKMPDFRNYAVDVPRPGTVEAEATRSMGQFLRDVMKLNEDSRNFRVMGPDETNSNRLNALFEATDRVFTGNIYRPTITFRLMAV